MSDSLGLDEPPQPRDAQPYRVLARKYRPQTFSELIGQDAMVQTLGNAIRRDRLAHAFLLTGVRGVGKTSTARLIAKALNCIGPDGQGGPTINPCGVCEPCRAIAEGRHIDVIEMDAASNTGVDSMREIIDAVRYAAVSARYKIYIIDEVHMLSNNAFNALLKTLEEPPAHVKFLFATTEVHKVPVTVLSRCQRFDLRRIPAGLLQAHFERVVGAEGFAAEPEALALIARAAEGSARDGLSILDQAIAHAGLEDEGAAGPPMVRADAVRAMLGLSDRGAIRALFDRLVAADGAGALALLREQYDLGVDPLAVLRTLLETVHAATLMKMGAEAGAQYSVEERAAFEGWAAGLSFPVLHRLWQLLLRGHDEVARAALPIEACEMVLLRVVHAADLPDPGELARMLASGAAPEVRAPVPASTAPTTPAPAPAAMIATAAPEAIMPPAAQRMPASLQEVADWLGARGLGTVEGHLRNLVRPIRFAPPVLEISSARPLPVDFVRRLSDALNEMTGAAWDVTIGQGEGGPTLREQREASAAAEKAAILASPIVAEAMTRFPDTELVSWTKTGTE